jgi:polar amino acid transport system substrate-binding protein
MTLGLLVIVATLSLSGCTSEDTNKIIIGTSADYPPFEFVAGNGTIVGFDIDLIKKILIDQGYTVEVQDIAFDSLIGSLETNKVDVIAAAMTIDAEREQRVDFSNPYYDANQSVIVDTGSGVNITNVSSLGNYKIGAQTGTTGWSWINDTLVATGILDEADFRSYEVVNPDAINDLRTGQPDRVAALIIDSPVAEAFTRLYNDVRIVFNITTNESYGFAVRNGDSELLSAINEGLAAAMNDTAYWNALVERYFATATT